MKLPKLFEDNMKELLKDEYEDYVACLDKPMFHALRVNTSKISVEEFLKISPFELTPVPWCENGFYYDENVCKPSKHPYYFAGLYYLQEPSAMTPANVIPIEEGDRVLDICAAPGGKSTELGSRLNGTGFLVSNDISASRAKALLKNIEVFGIGNVMITCEAPDKLSAAFPDYFDKILIDAPCSGEGMFRKSYSMVTAWEQNGNELFVNIQKSILNEAVKMLKPGGVILYSTCTFAPCEDEKSVEYLLSLDKNLKIIPFNKYKDFVDGKPEFSDTKSEDLKLTARLFPHKINGEGHFVALIKKDENAESTGHLSNYVTKRFKVTPEVSDFLKLIDKDIKVNRLELKGDMLYYIDDNCPDNTGLRTLRQGLLLGELKKNRFEPSQALAMNLKMSEFSLVLNLDIDDERVVKYLKGETIDISNDEVIINEFAKSVQKKKEGYILISVSGYPLGFGKLKNETIKNKYLPGWRMM